MNKFENLLVWQKSRSLVREIYEFCQTMPRSENRILIDQIKRASTSISLNIAEGSAAHNDKEFKHFLFIAKKSSAEVLAILKLIKSLYCLKTDPMEGRITEIIKMLNGLIRFLKNKRPSPFQSIDY